MISHDSIAWYCMLLRCWLRRAGCVSQDVYILQKPTHLHGKWPKTFFLGPLLLRHPVALLVIVAFPVIVALPVMYGMVSYDILWLHCMVLHAFTMLASARGLCLARRLYTTYNNMSLKQFMLLWYISRKQFTHFWHKCRKQIYFLWKVFARKIVPTGKLGFFRPLQRTRSL